MSSKSNAQRQTEAGRAVRLGSCLALPFAGGWLGIKSETGDAVVLFDAEVAADWVEEEGAGFFEALGRTFGSPPKVTSFEPPKFDDLIDAVVYGLRVLQGVQEPEGAVRANGARRNPRRTPSRRTRR